MAEDSVVKTDVVSADVRADAKAVEKAKAKTPRMVTGRVVSNAGNKSITVLVTRQVKHALYGKYLRRSTKLHAHDEENQCNNGDAVTIAECRPISKTKSWRLVSIDEAVGEAG